MNRYLAQRGFTKSGTAGLNLEKIESGRVGQIGNLESNLYSDNLSDALSYAFKPLGATSARTSVAPGNTGTGALSGGFTALMQALNQAMAAGGGN
jgi:hypothetical protein